MLNLGTLDIDKSKFKELADRIEQLQSAAGNHSASQRRPTVLIDAAILSQ